MTSIETTLEERGTRYGIFAEHARITQGMKRAMIDSPNWHRLDDDQRECLEMLAHKIGRILNGDPNYHDSWHDIVGYTKLVADRLALATETFAPLEDVFTLQEINQMIEELNQEEAASIDHQALNHPHIEAACMGDVGMTEVYQNRSITVAVDPDGNMRRVETDEQIAAYELVG